MTADAERHHIHALLQRKYWTIWLITRGAELFGDDPRGRPLDLGSGGFFRVERLGG